MAVKIKKNSRLRFGEVMTLDGVEFWDLIDPPTIIAQQDDIIHQIEGPERLDLLAYRYYEDPRLWWVIAQVNDLDIVPTEFNVGDELRIPSPRYIRQKYFKKALAQKG